MNLNPLFDQHLPKLQAGFQMLKLDPLILPNLDETVWSNWVSIYDVISNSSIKYPVVFMQYFQAMEVRIKLSNGKLNQLAKMKRVDNVDLMHTMDMGKYNIEVTLGWDLLTVKSKITYITIFNIHG